MAKGLDGVKKENDDRGSKLLAATGELRSAVYDQRQRLHALELSTDLRMSRALSDLRTQHAKVEGSVDQNRQQVADVRRGYPYKCVYAHSLTHTHTHTHTHTYNTQIASVKR